jgi:hypothetical protein
MISKLATPERTSRELSNCVDNEAKPIASESLQSPLAALQTPQDVINRRTALKRLVVVATGVGLISLASQHSKTKAPTPSVSKSGHRDEREIKRVEPQRADVFLIPGPGGADPSQSVRVGTTISAVVGAIWLICSDIRDRIRGNSVDRHA